MSRRFFCCLFSYFGVGSSSPPASRCCGFFWLQEASGWSASSSRGSRLSAGFWLSQSGSDRQCAWWSTTHGCSFFLFFLMIRVGLSWTWNSSGISCPQLAVSTPIVSPPRSAAVVRRWIQGNARPPPEHWFFFFLSILLLLGSRVPAVCHPGVRSG